MPPAKLTRIRCTDEVLPISPTHMQGKMDPSTATPFEASDHQAPPHTTYQDRMNAPDSAATIFKHAHDFKISGNPHFLNNVTVNQHSTPRDSQDLENFKEFVSFNAYYDSPVQDFDLKVHQAIHGKHLKQLQDWIDIPNATKQIIWLHGPASFGKTAIAQEIARNRQEKVAATFFFSKPDTTRNDGNRLFPTLAWQLADSIPDIKKHIIHVINEHHGLSKQGVEAQFEHLVVRPFAVMKEATSVDRVVIIDAVDECTDTQLQQRFLRVIGNAIRDCRIPLRFIISSRYDANMQGIFNQFEDHVLSIDLAVFDQAEELTRREQELKQREGEIYLAETRAHEKAEKSVQEIRRKLKEREEGIRRKEVQVQRAEEEARRQEEEAKRREEEARWKEARIATEEAGFKEVARNREAEIARRRQKLTKDGRKLTNKEKSLRKREEEACRREEDTEMRMKEIERREEALHQAEEMRQKTEETKRREELENRENQHEWRESESCLEEERQQQAHLQEEERQLESKRRYQFKQYRSLLPLSLLFLPFLPMYGYPRLILSKAIGLLHVYIPSWISYNDRRP